MPRTLRSPASPATSASSGLARLARFARFVALAAVPLSSVYACTTNGTVIPDEDATSTTVPRTDGASPPTDSATGGDAARPDAPASFDPTKVCAQELEYFAACKAPPGDINCTAARFEAWCTLNQAATDSAQRVRARAACLDVKHCDPNLLKDCLYKSYSTQQQTPAQAKLVADYCATCEPGDSTCPTRKIAYDAAKGPNSIDDVYLAAWELSEALTVAIDQKCTGPAIADAGADAGSCQKRFGNCAGGLFIDALPDCPK